MDEPEIVTIGTAARLTGLSPRKLRYLEEAGYVTPFLLATPGGRRLRGYDGTTLDRLRRLAELLAQGFPPRVAAAKMATAYPVPRAI